MKNINLETYRNKINNYIFLRIKNIFLWQLGLGCYFGLRRHNNILGTPYPKNMRWCALKTLSGSKVKLVVVGGGSYGKLYSNCKQTDSFPKVSSLYESAPYIFLIRKTDNILPSGWYKGGFSYPTFNISPDLTLLPPPCVILHTWGVHIKSWLYFLHSFLVQLHLVQFLNHVILTTLRFMLRLYKT